MSLLAALKLPVLPPVAPPAQPEAGVRGRDAAAFEQAKKLRDGMKDQLEKGWREAVEIAKKLDPGGKKGFVAQLQEVDKKRQEAGRLDGDPPGQVVVMAAALMGLKQARQAVGKPVSDGTDANTAYKSADGTSVEKPTSSPPAPPPVVAKKDAAEQQDPKQQAGAPPEVADLPQPVAADCKPARGRIPGPGHHLFCSTHGHVLDIKAKTIIARDLGDYKKRFPALVAANARVAQANAGKPAKTVNMEETQITGRGGTSMHLPTRAEAAKAKADAKRKLDADAHASREAERKHGELEKQANAGKPAKTVNMEEIQITGRGGTSMHPARARRNDIVNRQTNDAFYKLFPAAPKRLDPKNASHSSYIDYWLDIRDQIRDGASPRFNLKAIALAGHAPPLVSSQTNPHVGTVWESIWDDGYAAGYAARGLSPAPPEHLEPGAAGVWESGVEAGQYAAERDAHTIPVTPTGTHPTTKEVPSDGYGLPTIRVGFPGDPLGVVKIDAGMAYVVIDLSLTGNVTVDPPERVRGLSVDQSGYRVEVRNSVEGMFTGLRISGIGGGLTKGPISIGTTFGSEFTTTEIRQVSMNRVVYIGQVNLPGLSIPTRHGDATLRGQLGFQVGIEIHPKPQPVPVDVPWYEEAWDWVSDHAGPIAIVGVVVVGAVIITVASDGAAAPGAEKAVEWALAGAAL